MTTLIDGEEPGGGGGSGPSIWREACLAASNTNIADLTNVDLDAVFGPITSTWSNNQRLLVCLPASRDGLEPEDASHEGIFLVTGLFGGFASLVRSADMNVSGQFVPGVGVRILEGAHGASDYQLSVVLPFALDTDAQSWTELIFQLHSDNAHGARGFETSLHALLHPLVTIFTPGFMSVVDKIKLDSLGNIPGPIIFVSKFNIAPGTGTFEDPYVTIQQACDAVNPGDNAVILVVQGEYLENLAIVGTDRSITLCGFGPFILGDGVTTGNVVWTVETETTVKAELKICSLENEGSASILTQYDRPAILGTITAVTSSVPSSASLYLSCFAMGIDTSSLATASVTTVLRCDRSLIGTVSGTTTSLLYAEETTFNSLSVLTVGQLVRCVFLGTITLASSMPAPGPSGQSGFFACVFSNNITGPGGGNVYMDGSSLRSLRLGAYSIIGDTLTLIEEGLAEQTEYSPTTAGDWNGSPTEVKAGLDELASRVKGLEGGTPTPLYEMYACPVTVVVGDAVYLSGADTVDTASAASDATAPAIGFAISKPTTTTVNVQYDGSVGGFSLLTPGNTYFLDTVLGGITDDIGAFPNGAVEQKLGVARNTTTLLAKIDRDYTLIVV